MPPEKFLVFDAESDYAHFRNYTTTSPLTYPFPPRTTLAGLVAAIQGLPRDSYHGIFQRQTSRIAVQLMQPLRKVTIKQNIIKTNANLYLEKGIRKQVLYEYVRAPKYRVYVWHSDPAFFSDLCTNVSEHTPYFTPYLGVAHCLADVSFVGVFDGVARAVDGQGLEVSSTVPYPDQYEFVLAPDRRYGRVRTPGFMDCHRVVTEFIDSIFEEQGKPICIRRGNVVELSNGTCIAPV